LFPCRKIPPGVYLVVSPWFFNGYFGGVCSTNLSSEPQTDVDLLAQEFVYRLVTRRIIVLNPFIYFSRASLKSRIRVASHSFATMQKKKKKNEIFSVHAAFLFLSKFVSCELFI
jgi:hypothetical protein